VKLEDQVVSLPLAKRLKELGVKQDSYFVWQDINQVGAHLTESWAAVGFEHSNAEHTSAFTVAELGEMLPFEAMLCYSNKLNDIWNCLYAIEKREGVLEVTHNEQASTEADARAKMLIHLKENHTI
jgi:hypothetical protein